MKKLNKREILNRVADALFWRNKPEYAIELRDLRLATGISEDEAFMALNYFINDEISIRLTDGLPHKLYC